MNCKVSRKMQILKRGENWDLSTVKPLGDWMAQPNDFLNEKTKDFFFNKNDQFIGGAFFSGIYYEVDEEKKAEYIKQCKEDAKQREFESKTKGEEAGKSLIAGLMSIVSGNVKQQQAVPVEPKSKKPKKSKENVENTDDVEEVETTETTEDEQ